MKVENNRTTFFKSEKGNQYVAVAFSENEVDYIALREPHIKSEELDEMIAMLEGARDLINERTQSHE